MARSAAVAPAIVAAALTLTLSITPLFEGRVKTSYRDPVGVLTVCDGHTGPEVRPNQTYTDVQCNALLRADVKEAMDAVLALTTGPINQNELAALTDFTFNAGRGNLASSTLLRKFNAGDHIGACRELPKWVYAKGVKLAGLVKRRAQEMALCLRPTK
jgi:lysozyme